jgi:hypothetical protein
LAAIASRSAGGVAGEFRGASRSLALAFYLSLRNVDARLLELAA